MAVTVNTIVSGGGSGGGGGSTTFTGLTDASTANIPAINIPLAKQIGINPVAMAGNAIDITNLSNTKTLATPTTLTFSATPTVAGTSFGLILTMTAGAMITLPSVFDDRTQTTITQSYFPIGEWSLSFYYDGSRTVMYGNPDPINNATTTSPGTSNDNTQGFGVGSQWLNTTTSTVYTCFSAAIGAAVWATPATTSIIPDFGGGDSFYWTTDGGGSTGFASLGSGGSPYVVGTNNARTGLFGSRIWPIRAGIDAASASKARATWGDAQPGSAPHNTFVPTTNTLDKPIYGRGGLGVTDTAGLGCVNTIGWLSAVNFNLDGSAQRNCFCLSNDAADANYSIITANASAATKIALGSAFPVNSTSTDAYEVYLSLTGGATPVASYYVINRMTGVVARGTTQATLPVPATPLAWNNQRIAPTAAAAVSIDVIAFSGGGFAQQGNS